MEDRPDTPSYSLQPLPLPGTPSALPEVLVLSPPPRNPASSADWSLACRGAEPKGRDVTGRGGGGQTARGGGDGPRLSTSESSLPGLVLLPNRRLGREPRAGHPRSGRGMAVEGSRGPDGQKAQP